MAVLSLYLNYRARTSPYREMLYARQLEGYARLIDKLAETFDSAAEFLLRHDWRLDDSSRVEFSKHMDTSAPAIYMEQHKYAAFMSKKFTEEITSFLSVLLALGASPETAAKYPHEIVHAEDHGKVLQAAFAKVIEAAREGLGTEPLSQETLRLIGRGPRK